MEILKNDLLPTQIYNYPPPDHTLLLRQGGVV